MSLATSISHSALESKIAPLIDTHLIMNALNQIAARDIDQKRGENPLLFALSDYLREALTKLDSLHQSVKHDAQLMETHLLLYSNVAHIRIELEIINLPATSVLVSRGMLSKLAITMMKAIRSASNSWHMQVAFENIDHASKFLEFCIAIRSIGFVEKIDLSTVRNDLAQLSIIKTRTAMLLPVTSASSQVGFRFRTQLH